MMRAMPISPLMGLPKRVPRGLAAAAKIRVSPQLLDCSGGTPEEVIQRQSTTAQGLSEAEAAKRLYEYGPNVVAQEQRHPKLT